MSKKPSEKIWEIWREMKALKDYRGGFAPNDETAKKRREELEEKYENIEILFGHESTLDKAIIYFFDQQYGENNQVK